MRQGYDREFQIIVRPGRDAEIGGAWLVWQGWRTHRGLWWVAVGVIPLGAYGFVATF